MEKLISIGNLFKESFEIYKKRGFTLAGIFLVNSASYLIIGLSFILIGTSIWHYEPFNTNLGAAITLSILVSLLVSFLLNSWTTLSGMIAIKENNIGAMQSLSGGWSKLLPGLWIYFLDCLIVMAGTVLFIIPGIIFAIWLLFAPFLFIFEGKKGKEALKASKKLVSGYWWPVFFRILLMMAVFVAVDMVFNKTAGGLINLFITTPFFLIYRYQIYKDLKRIKNIV